MVVQELGRIARICSHSHLFVLSLWLFMDIFFSFSWHSRQRIVYFQLSWSFCETEIISANRERAFVTPSVPLNESNAIHSTWPHSFRAGSTARPPSGLSRHSFGWHPLLTTLIAVVPPSLAHGLYSTWAEGLVRFRGGLGFGLGIEIGFGFGLRAWGRVGVTDTHWVMIGSGFQLGIQIQLGLWLRLGLEFALGSGLGIGIGKWLGFGFGFGCTQFGLAVQLWAEGK